MMNLPEHTPQPNPPGVAAPTVESDSPFPAALATCAADALICPTRVELDAHWLNTVPGYAAINEWYALLKFLDASPMKPALN